MTSPTNKYYIHQIYRNGVFLGVLPNVVSEFMYSQDIRSAGAQLQLEVSETPDHSADAPDTIQTEEGIPIQTEANENLLTEGTPDLVGNANAKALIRNNNDIKVYEVSANYPNGRLVFNGWISKWKASFGVKDTITVSCLSNGSELDNALVEGPLTADQSQTTYSMYGSGVSHALWNGLKTTPTAWQHVAQSFTVGAGITTLAAYELHLAADTVNDYCEVQVDVYAYDGSVPFYLTTSLGSARRTINSTSDTIYKFVFPSVISVASGQQYIAVAKPILPDGSTGVYVQIGATSPSAYANGRALVSTETWPDHSLQAPPVGFFAGDDLYFKTYSTSGATSYPYSSQDPTLILRDIIDNFVARGGTINYGTGTTDLTSTSRAYTFKVNTVLEAIQKIQDISPYNWYWYVNPATDTLYFKQTSTTADIVFIKGRHIQSLEIEANVETVKNKVYFTGGDVGGNVNLFQTLSDATALAANAGRVGIARITDNRVLLSDTASAIISNYISGNKNESYQTSLVINDATYDTSLIALGKVIGFEGFGNFVDSLLLQVVRIEYHADFVAMALGVLPQRASTQVEDIERQLDEVQTLYNPTTPS